MAFESMDLVFGLFWPGRLLRAIIERHNTQQGGESLYAFF